MAVRLRDQNLVEASAQVDLAEILGVRELVEQLIRARQRVAVLHGLLIEEAVVCHRAVFACRGRVGLVHIEVRRCVLRLAVLDVAVREHLFDPPCFKRRVLLILPRRVAVRWPRARTKTDTQLVTAAGRQARRQLVRKHVCVLRQYALAQRGQRGVLVRPHRTSVVGVAQQRRQHTVANVIIVIQFRGVQFQNSLHQLRRRRRRSRTDSCQRNGAATSVVIQRDRARCEVDNGTGGRQPRQAEDNIVTVQLCCEQLLRLSARRVAEGRECNWCREDALGRSELAVVAAHQMLRREHQLLQAVSPDEANRNEVARCAAVDEAARSLSLHLRVDAEQDAGMWSDRGVRECEGVSVPSMEWRGHRPPLR